MVEPVSFATLLLESARLFLKQRLLFLFVFLFGSITFFSSQFTETPPPISSLETTEHILTWVDANHMLVLTLLGSNFFFTLISALIRGSLFLTIEETLLPRARHHTNKIKLFKYLRASLIAFRTEVFYSLFLFSLAFLLFLPVFFAWKFNAATLPFIFNLALLFLLGILVVFYFIKEYAVLYQILAGTSFRIALDLGYALFRKRFGLSLIFGMFLLALFLCFTFILDSAIIWSARFFGDEMFVGSAILLFVFSGCYWVYENIFRLLFFHSLAAEKKKPEKSKIVQEETLETSPE